MKNSVLKTSVVVLATIAAGFCATPAAAETIHAKVLSSSPIYKSVVTYVPQQVCMDEVVSHNTQNQYNHNGGIINSGVNGIFGSTQGMIGATIGGVIGNEIGGGSGRDIARGVGIILGSQIGNQRQQRSSTRYGSQTIQKVCRTVTTQGVEQRIDGWNVMLDVNGRSVSMYSPYQPGEYMSINVNQSYSFQ